MYFRMVNVTADYDFNVKHVCVNNYNLVTGFGSTRTVSSTRIFLKESWESDCTSHKMMRYLLKSFQYQWVNDSRSLVTKRNV